MKRARAAVAEPEPATFREAIADHDPRKLAAAANVSVQSVYKWRREQGGSLPGLDIVPDLARFMGWPTAKLLALVVKEGAARRQAARK